jgi:RNA polymerase sigma factor (sigma-70 family)
MTTLQQNKFQMPFNVLPETSITGQFNLPDWRKASSDEVSDLSEDVLVSAARSGQEWAFVELCFRSSKRILFTLNRITKNREDAEDALQESILKAFVHFGTFNRASAFSTWFTRIAINSALMILRRRRTRPEISNDVPADDSVKKFQWEMPTEASTRKITALNLKGTAAYRPQFPGFQRYTGTWLRANAGRRLRLRRSPRKLALRFRRQSRGSCVRGRHCAVQC